MEIQEVVVLFDSDDEGASCPGKNTLPAAFWKKAEKKVAEDAACWSKQRRLAGSAGGSKARQDAVPGGGFTKRRRAVGRSSSKRHDASRASPDRSLVENLSSI
ncbi:hypothetical protein QYE76_035328 [Lolium multiflorum]|uniref:Uncharacterized protein n=1 Tax=Lolium multiflorum TaxID=4521 RepID=A0AAD8QYT5_LOLMU|nr:hypothetical protein QYE76_035328 [Lolium multiflorum]